MLPIRLQEVHSMWRVAHRNTFTISRLALLAFGPMASPAWAQGLGVRAGASVDPDQFYFGGHYESRPLVEQLHFRPNVELGVGDDITTVGLNFEFVYKIPIQDSPWSLYAGGGPAVNFYSFNDNNETEGGLNVLFGAETAQGLFFELKLGALDSPDLKVGVGYTWR
jgi:hypothetical protein